MRGNRRIRCFFDNDCFCSFARKGIVFVFLNGYRISARVFEIAYRAVFCEYKVCGFAVIGCRGRGLSVGTINVTFRNSPVGFGRLFVYREFAGDKRYVIVIACGKSRNGNYVIAGIRACAAVNRFARKIFALYKPRDGVRKCGRIAVSYRDVVNRYGYFRRAYRKLNASFFFRAVGGINNLKVYRVRARIDKVKFSQRFSVAFVCRRAVHYLIGFTCVPRDQINVLRRAVVRHRFVVGIYFESVLNEHYFQVVRDFVICGNDFTRGVFNDDILLEGFIVNKSSAFARCDANAAFNHVACCKLADNKILASDFNGISFCNVSDRNA